MQIVIPLLLLYSEANANFVTKRNLLFDFQANATLYIGGEIEPIIIIFKLSFSFNLVFIFLCQQDIGVSIFMRTLL